MTCGWIQRTTPAAVFADSRAEKDQKLVKKTFFLNCLQVAAIGNRRQWGEKQHLCRTKKCKDTFHILFMSLMVITVKGKTLPIKDMFVSKVRKYAISQITESVYSFTWLGIKESSS